MTEFPTPTLESTDIDRIAAAEGTVAVLVPADGSLDRSARRVERLTRGALGRLVAGEAFAKAAEGDVAWLDMPVGLTADRLVVAKLERRPDALTTRRAGAAIAARALGGKPLRLEAGARRDAAELVYGMALRSYAFDQHRTGDSAPAGPGAVVVAANRIDGLEPAIAAHLAVAAGVHQARDLTNEPSNVLTTTEFANRISALGKLGVEVEILEEKDLERLGMRLLLGVGQGSHSPSKVAVMQWRNGGPEAPLALVGKGVVFDTGGVSLKPAGGMEEMTMDMGGAAVVVGAMQAIAGRKAAAHVVGVIGLVENMPDGMAQRPGDVLASMKGDTVEIINTDAEGRLVLADALWYTQERFAPSAIIDLATLTGAIIIGLGHHMCGGFANDDDFWTAFSDAAKVEGEPLWRMPLGQPYAKDLKSRVADVANVGGRPGGAVIAAEFLRRFVKDGTPWVHLDIAGVATSKSAGDFAPKGATGWGVRTIDRLVRNLQEGRAAP